MSQTLRPVLTNIAIISNNGKNRDKKAGDKYRTALPEGK